MYVHYSRQFLYISLVIYIIVLFDCVNLEDPLKSKDKLLKEPPSQKHPEEKKENVILSNEISTNEKSKENFEENILKDSSNNDALKNEEDSSNNDALKNEEESLSEYKDESDSSSHIYKPTHINKDNIKDKSLTSGEYAEILKKISMEVIQNNNIELNKIKEKIKKILEESKEFPGTAEETILLQEMLDNEYKEYLLTVDEMASEDTKSEIDEAEEQNPNPSFSDLNSKEILHTALPDNTLKPPESSNSKSTSTKATGSDQEKPKKEPELTEEEKQGNSLCLNFHVIKKKKSENIQINII